jgi:hypothetical protein
VMFRCRFCQGDHRRAAPTGGAISTLECHSKRTAKSPRRLSHASRGAAENSKIDCHSRESGKPAPAGAEMAHERRSNRVTNCGGPRFREDDNLFLLRAKARNSFWCGIAEARIRIRGP